MGTGNDGVIIFCLRHLLVSSSSPTIGMLCRHHQKAEVNSKAELSVSFRGLSSSLSVVEVLVVSALGDWWLNRREHSRFDLSGYCVTIALPRCAAVTLQWLPWILSFHDGTIF